ncbi:MAG: hypothetical protein JNK48_24245 [Bryobacterales bacterium]|nr:hypothetical protein [Bryobacterales bacterium]
MGRNDADHGSLHGRERRVAAHTACAAALFAVNAYLVAELFHREFIDQTGSIEAAYISLARYIKDNWNDLTWFPLWYNGIPFQDSYPPLLHVLSALVSGLLGIAPGTGYHAVCGLLFALGPVTLYAFAVRCGASMQGAFLGGLAYTVISPSALLVEPIYADLGQMIAGRRLQDLAAWGEGPHVSGLTLFPVALLLLDLAWRKASPRYDLAAAAGMAATAMTNWHASLTLALGIVCWLIPNFTGARLARTAWTGLLAYALAAPWIPPSTVAVVRANARVIGGDFAGTYAALPVRTLAALAAMAFAAYLLRRLRLPPIAQFGVFFSLITAAFTLGAYWYGVKLVPQPERYHLQMEMGLCLLAGLAAAALLSLAPRWAQAATMAAIVVACIGPVKQVRRVSREAHLRPLDMERTIYGRLGRWLRENRFEQRIYAPGAKTAWLNAFCDTPQFDGGFAQGLVNLKLREAWHFINLAKTKEETVLWARAFGIHAILGSLPHSPDPYKPLNFPEKLRGLETLWEGEGETLYRIPHRSSSLARIVPIPALPESLDNVTTYVNALEDASLPEANFQWTSRHSATVEASLHPHHAVSLQWTYHAGWRARVNGVPRTLREDGIGQMALEPGCDGVCRIELSYDGGWEMRVARLLPWLAMLTILRRARREWTA